MVKSPTAELLVPDRLDLNTGSHYVPSYQGNSVTRLKDGGMTSSLNAANNQNVGFSNFANKFSHNDNKPTWKKRPVVMIKLPEEGTLKDKFQYELREKPEDTNYGYKSSIDKYFKNTAVNKLLFESKEEAKRYKEIQQLKVPLETKTFEEYYKK